MNHATCTHCTAPTADGIYLCDQAEGDLFALLGQIPDTLADAQDTIARLERKGQNNGSTARGHNDGLSIEALDHVITLKKLLESWAQMLLEETQEAVSEDPAHYLRANLREIVRHDWAGDMLTELTEAHQSVERAVDTRDEVVILQRCGTLLEDGTHCEAKLKLRDKEQQWVKCPNCGSWFSVDAVRREQALKARGEPMTPKDCRAYFPGDVLHLHLEMRMRRHNGRVAHNDV